MAEPRTKIPRSIPLATQCETASRLLKALAHPQRLLLLCVLSAGEKSVGELVEMCGTSQSIVSQFLIRMKSEGILASRKQSNFVYYRIEDGKTRDLIDSLHRIFKTG